MSATTAEIANTVSETSGAALRPLVLERILMCVFPFPGLRPPARPPVRHGQRDPNRLEGPVQTAKSGCAPTAPRLVRPPRHVTSAFVKAEVAFLANAEAIAGIVAHPRHDHSLPGGSQKPWYRRRVQQLDG